MKRWVLSRIWLVLAFAILTCPAASWAHMTVDLAEALAPPGYDIGPADKSGVVFPLIKAGRVEGYIFDTLDHAAIPGFSGTPIEMVVSMDARGTIMDVHLLHQNEPVFVDGLGVQPFIEFLKQYAGKHIRQSISVNSVYGGRGAVVQGENVILDGVTKASASVRIANVTILSSAVAVARTHLPGAAPPTGALIRDSYRETLDWDALVSKHYIATVHVTNAQVQEAFAGSITANDDPDADTNPDPGATFADLSFTLCDVPSIGIALFGEAGYKQLMAHLDPGDHAVAVFGNGRWTFMPDDFVRGTQPARLKLEQAGYAIGGRDVPFGLEPLHNVPAAKDFSILRIPGSAGLDPAQPWSLSILVSREHGVLQPERETRFFAQTLSLPAKFFTRPAASKAASWTQAWTERWDEIAIVTVLLAALTAVLVRQREVLANSRRFHLIRLALLTVTVGWVGWKAQAQLSIVTVLGLVKAAFHGTDLGFLLYDPVSLILWVFTLIGLAVWGRGAFCGWLCPFGALQEFAALLGKRLGLARIGRRVPAKVARQLRLVKYLVLAVLVVGTAWNAVLSETLAEAEPFKTAITLGFNRSLPFQIYAALWLIWGLIEFKPFCRFACPLGASLALGGRLRRWKWIPRRAECGTPCKLCEKRCDYGAILPSGTVDYDECFQCLDCVGIYHDRATCVPLILEDRRRSKT